MNALEVVKSLQWSNGLFDLTWSESRPDVVVSGSGDGSLQVWQLDTQVNILYCTNNEKYVYRLITLLVVVDISGTRKSLEGASKRGNAYAAYHIGALVSHLSNLSTVLQVNSVDWSLTRDVNHIISASWDHTLRLVREHNEFVFTFCLICTRDCHMKHCSGTLLEMNPLQLSQDTKISCTRQFGHPSSEAVAHLFQVTSICSSCKAFIDCCFSVLRRQNSAHLGR